MLRLLPLFALVSLACGPAARPADIPPTAPDFARASPGGETVALVEDDEDLDDDEAFDGFGASAADAAFDAATAEAPTEASDEAEAAETEGGSADPSTEPTDTSEL